MPDDNTDTTAPAAIAAVDPTVPVTVAPVPEVKTFTQDQVNAFVQQRLAADRATRSKVEPLKQEPTKAAPVAADSDVRAELEEMKLRNAFDKRMAKLDAPDATAERLFKLYRIENPEDPAAWFDVTAKEFGLKPPQITPPVSATAATSNVAPTAAPTAAAPNAPARVDGTTNAGLVDLFSLTPAQIDQFGPSGLRKHFEEATSIGRQLSGAPTRPKLPTSR